MSKLKKNQRETLEWCRNLQEQGYSGIGQVERGQWRHLTTLRKLGLLEYVGHGMCETADDDREYPIYALTDAGRAAIEEVPGE